jgi:hypothetical protein
MSGVANAILPVVAAVPDAVFCFFLTKEVSLESSGPKAARLGLFSMLSNHEGVVEYVLEGAVEGAVEGTLDDVRIPPNVPVTTSFLFVTFLHVASFTSPLST